MEHEQQPQKKGLDTSTAIIIAGILIALAILGTNSSLKDKIKVWLKPTPTRIAFALGVSVNDYKACVAEGASKPLIAKQEEEARIAGAQGTPFNIIVTKTGKTLVIPGALTYDKLKPLLDEILANPESTRIPWTTDAKFVYQPVNTTDHIRGAADPAITIIEYSDLDCPYCKLFHGVLEQAMKDYGTQIAWVYRHSPIDSLHPDARNKAIGAECVAKLKGEEAFWKFVDKVMAN